MNENLENRCMSLRDEELQINCSDNGADVISAIIDDLKKYANYPEPLSVIVKKAVEVLKEQQIVRCKDCIRYPDCCRLPRNDPNWFCADGKFAIIENPEVK